MPFITVGEENSQAIRIYFEDHGTGRSVLLVHGFLLNGHSWEKQEAALLDAGYRVVTYDRRGFGSSSRPSIGYEYDTLAADLAHLVNALDLNDVTLVGFSTGAGDIIRYLGTCGSSRISSAVLLAPVPPFLPGTADRHRRNRPGVFGSLAAAISADRPGAIKTYLDDFYNIDVLGSDRVSDQAWQQSFNVAIAASAKATLDCVNTSLEDLRSDFSKFDLPVLVIQGDQDRIIPPEVTGDLLPPLAEHIGHLVILGGPHAIIWTHADEVNAALLDFLEQPGA
jgi:non-heme chloroperoxidase